MPLGTRVETLECWIVEPKIIDDKKEAFNIEPSWLEDHYDNSGPFDVYPVKTIARQDHKIIAGGGPATCNGEWWSMAALTKFE